MSAGTKYVIGGVAVGVLALLLFPWWVTLLILGVGVAAPVAGYLLLDPHQRRRLRRVTRKQLNR